jgi:DNA polymerase I-like protein with 3'-5' exonuclease and polymerase domains
VFLAIDTETTGPCFEHGCRPFAVSACDEVGKKFYWRALVNPITRIPEWDYKTLKEIRTKLLSYSEWVFFNATFDLKALLFIGAEQGTKPEFTRTGMDLFYRGKELVEKRKLHDTMLVAHLLNSKGTRGLKNQALLHCDILDDDEHELDGAVKTIHNEYRNRSVVTIAKEGHPHFPGIKDDFHKMDMWLPEWAAKTKKLPKDHDWWHVCKRYAILDAVRTGALHIVQQNTIDDFRSDAKHRILEAKHLNHRVIYPVIGMERHGMNLLKGKFERELSTIDNKREEVVDTLRNIIGIKGYNPNSGPQNVDILFRKLGYEPEGKTKSGNLSTDKNTLPKLLLQKSRGKIATAFVEKLMEYREVKAAAQYLSSYDRFRLGYRLYPSYIICGTSTTRMSSHDPNGQNVSKGKEQVDDDGNLLPPRYSLRSVFGPPRGRKWISIDYDQLQLRIFSYWSGEEKLIEAIANGFDFHTTVAKYIFGVDEPTKAQRRIAKNTNFGIIFGAGKAKIDKTSGLKGTYNMVMKLFPNVGEAIARASSFARQYGYVETASGYRLIVPRNKPYVSVNYIVQGTEGDIVKKALADTHEYLEENYDEDDAAVNAQIHDELLFEFASKIFLPTKKLVSIMENAGSYYGVVCKCKPERVLGNWAQAEALAV